MMELFGGLDIGTNGVRLILVDEALEMHYQNQVMYETSSPAEGRAEQNPESIFQASSALLNEAINKFPDEKLYISFSSVMHSIMLVDYEGDNLTPLIIWADTRAREECNYLAERYTPENFYRETGCPLHSAYWPAKISWLSKNYFNGKGNLENTEVTSATDKPGKEDILYVSIKEYIVYRLSGLWIADYAIASTSGIFNPLNKDYQDSILGLLDISRDNLSKLVPPEYSFEFELAGKKIIGICGSTDGPLANLGSGAVRDDSIVLTAGSSSAVRFLSKETVLDNKSRVWNYILDRDYYVLGEATNGAGILLNWLASIFQYRDAEDMVNDNLKSIPYNINGLYCLPTMMGERGPGYNEGLRGIFYGLSLNHSKEDMILSLYESIAFFLKMVFDDVKRVIQRNKDRIIITGGLGISPFFRELISYLVGDIKYLQQYDESSALGAAMLAIKVIKGKPYEEQLELLPEPSPVTISSDNSFSRSLSNKYENFIKLYNEMASFHKLLS